MSDARAAVSEALSELTSSELVDEDAAEYIISILEGDARDTESRDTVASILSSIVEDEDDGAVEQFFERLDAKLSCGVTSSMEAVSIADDQENTLRKLDTAITMKQHDVQTFASGLVAEKDSTMDQEGQSDIQAFYANMIDVTNNPKALSERNRRKERQKQMRQKMEDDEHKRAVEDELRMLEEDLLKSSNEANAQELTTANDNAADVHFIRFSLPNKKGGGPDLVVDSNLTLASGRRYGLMGRNGCGKTTLLTALASRQLNDGRNGVPKNMSMLLVRQEIMGNQMNAIDTVLKSDVKREGVKRWIQSIENDLNRLDNPEEVATTTEEPDEGKKLSKSKQKLKDRKRKTSAVKKIQSKKTSLDSAELAEDRRKMLNVKLADAYERLAQIEQEEGDPEPRARKVLNGLGFSTEMQDKPTSELSGGWRMRVSLSSALFANPALLLLDEPTNHLDLEAVLWLEKYLIRDFKGTLVVVSHDRAFLDEVVTDVVHFHRAQLTTYRGDISNFTAVREENRKRQIRQFEQQEAKRAHLQKRKYIDLHAQAGENGVKAAKQRKSRMKKLDKIGVMAASEGKKFKASYDGEAEEIEEYQEDEEVELSFPDPGSFNGNIVALNQVSFGYAPDKTLLKDVDLTIDMKSRMALLGRNGSGKSTLIKIIVGALQATNGSVSIDPAAKIEYLAQHQLEQLDPDSNPMLSMLERYPGDGTNHHKGELRRYLATFGLGGEDLPVQKIHTMSGGQKCRLCLALSMYRKPHLLILDEPTNHLDLETTEALIQAIDKFEGGVLLVSHDQHLLTSVCEHLYVVHQGEVELLKHGITKEETFKRYKKDVIAGRR